MKAKNKALLFALVCAPFALLTACDETSSKSSAGGNKHSRNLPSIDPGVSVSKSKEDSVSLSANPEKKDEAREALIDCRYSRQDISQLKVISSGSTFHSVFDLTRSSTSAETDDTNDSSSSQADSTTINLKGKADRKDGNTDTRVINLQETDRKKVKASSLNSGYFDITEVSITETKKGTASSGPTKKEDFHGEVGWNAYLDDGVAYLDRSGLTSLIKNYTDINFFTPKRKRPIGENTGSTTEKQTREQIEADLTSTENSLSKDITYSKEGDGYSMSYTFDSTDLDRHNLTTIFDNRNISLNRKYTSTRITSFSCSGSRKMVYSKKARKLIVDSLPESDEKTTRKNRLDQIPLEKADITLTGRNTKYDFTYSAVVPVTLTKLEKAGYIQQK